LAAKATSLLKVTKEVRYFSTEAERRPGRLFGRATGGVVASRWLAAISPSIMSSAYTTSRGRPPPMTPTAILIESGSVMRIAWQKRSISFSVFSSCGRTWCERSYTNGGFGWRSGTGALSSCITSGRVSCARNILRWVRKISCCPWRERSARRISRSGISCHILNAGIGVWQGPSNSRLQITRQDYFRYFKTARLLPALLWPLAAGQEGAAPGKLGDAGARPAIARTAARTFFLAAPPILNSDHGAGRG